jgi:hypothetical protein
MDYQPALAMLRERRNAVDVAIAAIEKLALVRRGGKRPVGRPRKVLYLSPAAAKRSR